MNNIIKKELIGLSPNSKKIKNYKNMLKKLSEVQYETLIGLMLGDASIQTQNKGKSYRIKFEWGEKNKAYLDHVYNVFDEWVLSVPHKKTRISPKGNLVTNWAFQTISHSAFVCIATLFIKHKKIIDDNLVKNHLTPRGLSYWFMDDGLLAALNWTIIKILKISM